MQILDFDLLSFFFSPGAWAAGTYTTIVTFVGDVSQVAMSVLFTRYRSTTIGRTPTPTARAGTPNTTR